MYSVQFQLAVLLPSISGSLINASFKMIKIMMMRRRRRMTMMMKFYLLTGISIK